MYSTEKDCSLVKYTVNPGLLLLYVEESSIPYTDLYPKIEVTVSDSPNRVPLGTLTIDSALAQGRTAEGIRYSERANG